MGFILKHRNRIIWKIYFVCLSILSFSSCDGDGIESSCYSIYYEFNRTSEYIVLFGDIQNYTDNDHNLHFYRKSIDWIVNKQKAFGNIKGVFHMGDVTNTNYESEWESFYEETIKLDAYVPYYSVPGNHDYAWDTEKKIHDRSTCRINDYLNFPNSEKNIVAYYEEEQTENIVVRLTVRDIDFYFLLLEFAPRKEVVAWARQYVATHTTEKFFLVTHEWMNRDGSRISSDTYGKLHFAGTGTNFSSPEEIWQTLVYPNANIMAVVCGHNGFSRVLKSRNVVDREVPQILFNIQYLPNGGDGVVELWEFSPDSLVKVVVYNTIEESPYRIGVNDFVDCPIYFELGY